MVHIKLTTIKAQLQDRMNYPTKHLLEDDGFLTLDEAFEELLRGFLKRTCTSSSAASQQRATIIKRGWMSEKQAEEFTDYCIKGWKIV